MRRGALALFFLVTLFAFSFLGKLPYESDSNEKNFIAGDNLDIVEIVEEVLAYEHYEVKSTTKSIDFIRVAESFRPDLIILDYKLGDGNGGELCLALKAHPKLTDIPVIIFSAYSQPGMDFMHFGCDAVISKPFDLENLVHTVERLLLSALPDLFFE